MIDIAPNNDDVRKSIYSRSSAVKKFDNVHMGPAMVLKGRKVVRFCISDSQTRGANPGQCYTSPEFVVSGERWFFLYYPRGMQDGKTVSLHLQREHPSGAIVVIFMCTLLDQRWKPVTWESGFCNFSSSESYGWDDFAKRITIEMVSVDHDEITIECELYIYEDPGASASSLANPSLLARLLTEDTADITVGVEGEYIPAHKCFLAAQSPVLKAMLYGPLSELKSGHIEIPYMKASVFKAMLHYLYTESLPSYMKLDDESGQMSVESIMVAQHLLEAADRYAIEGLGLKCEKLLCESITVDTVAFTLALALQHNRTELKYACLAFIEEPENAPKVMVSDGFFHLVESCPEVRKELKKNLKLLQYSKGPPVEALKTSKDMGGNDIVWEKPLYKIPRMKKRRLNGRK